MKMCLIKYRFNPVFLQIKDSSRQFRRSSTILFQYDPITNTWWHNPYYEASFEELQFEVIGIIDKWDSIQVTMTSSEYNLRLILSLNRDNMLLSKGTILHQSGDHKQKVYSIKTTPLSTDYVMNFFSTRLGFRIVFYNKVVKPEDHRRKNSFSRIQGSPEWAQYKFYMSLTVRVNVKIS